MVAARGEILAHCPVTDAREQASEIVRRAADRGETAPTVQQILDHIIAPLYYRIVFALQVDENHARRLVDDVLAVAPQVSSTSTLGRKSPNGRMEPIHHRAGHADDHETSYRSCIADGLAPRYPLGAGA